MKKTLSIILSVLMIVSCIPIIAFAQEKLTAAANVDTYPTITYKTADGKMYYGQSYEEALQLNDDEIVLNAAGEQVAGRFVIRKPEGIPEPGVDKKLDIIFEPDDQEAYSTFTKLRSPITYTVEEVELVPVVEGETIPTASEVEPGALLSTSILSGAEFTNPYNPYEPNLASTTWRWANAYNNALTTVVNESGYYTAIFDAVGYEQKVAQVYVRVIGDDSEQEEDTAKYGSIISWPTFDCSVWTPGLKLSDIVLTGGEATVEGSFSVVPATGNTEYIKPNFLTIARMIFTPDDSEVIMTTETSKTLTFTARYTLQDFEAEPTKANTLEFGTALNGRTALGWFGIETNLPEGIRADMRLVSAVDENGNEVDIRDRYLVPGTYTATATVYVPEVDVEGVGKMLLYNDQTVEVTYIITKKTETSRFASASLHSFTDDFAEVYLQYTAKAGANGYCVVKAGDDILLDNITSEAAIVRIPAHKSGTYTLTFEYIPAEDDCIEFSSTVIEIGEVTFNVATTPDDGGDDDTGDNGDDNVTTDCKCLCHSNNSILQIIWKLINFLCRLFGINQNCACGAAHYDAPIFG